MSQGSADARDIAGTKFSRNLATYLKMDFFVKTCEEAYSSVKQHEISGAILNFIVFKDGINQKD